MRMVKHWSIILLSVFLIGTGTSLGQTTGKISGTVTDAETGEPLIGVNILVKDTEFGGATDVDGEFFILNIHPGVYNIEARYIGYATTTIQDVQVSVNRTARVAFKMPPSVIDGEEVTIVADRISVKKDQTNSIRNVSSEDISVLPVESISAVVAMQPGVVNNHFRGGRSNEAIYMIDGVKTTESFRQESQAVNVNPEAAQDIEIITGTFNAEYGDAMSGVVNIVTKEGGNKFDGSVSASFGNYLTSHTDKFIGLSNSEFDRIQDVRFNVSGPVFSDKLTFFIDGRKNKDDGYLNGLHYFNPHDYSNYDSDDPAEWITEHTGDSSFVSMSWNDNLLLFGKLTYRVTNSIKMSLSANFNNREGQWYSHANKYNPLGMPTNSTESLMFSYQVNHMLSPSAFYDLKLSWSDYQVGNYMYKDPTDPRYVHDEYSRSNGFSTGGDSKGHTIRGEENLNLKLDYSWQINKNHFLKTGVDVSQITLNQQYSTIQNKFNGSGVEYDNYFDENGELQYPNYAPVTFPDSSTHSDIYTHKPIKFAYYVQDKMEFNSMVVNMGVRFDYFDPDAIYPSNYRNPANTLFQLEESRYSTYPKADKQYQLSPRLGLSYQLGDAALLRFSYGHFLQLPPLDYYYQNNAFLVQAPDFTSRMGNANLNAQKTIQYEVGLWQQLNSMMSVEVAVYYRDIYDLVSATTYTTYDQTRYGVYTNLEYGNARGLEVKYDFQHAAFSAGINYTLAYTRGVADNPTMSFSRAGASMDPVNKMIPMSWDQRHVFNTYVGYQKPNYGATLVFYFYSGEAYTWQPIAQSPTARINLFPNNQHKPMRNSLDLNAHYNIASFGDTKIRLTLLAYNLLDRLNEVDVDANTGRAYQAIIQETDLMGHRSVYHDYEEQVLIPSRFSTPRMIKVGLGFVF